MEYTGIRSENIAGQGWRAENEKKLKKKLLRPKYFYSKSILVDRLQFVALCRYLITVLLEAGFWGYLLHHFVSVKMFGELIYYYKLCRILHMKTPV